MPNLASVSRINILTAIRDHDLQGAVQFGEALGFDDLGDDVLVERGRRYDARALLSYAHGKATGEYLTPDEITFGSFKVLTDHGFTVASRTELVRAKASPASRPARTPRTPAAPRATKPEPVIKLCPTCFTQLSVSGTCNFCE